MSVEHARALSGAPSTESCLLGVRSSCVRCGLLLRYAKLRTPVYEAYHMAPLSFVLRSPAFVRSSALRYYVLLFSALRCTGLRSSVLLADVRTTNLRTPARAPTRRNAFLSPPLRCEASHSTSSESPAPHYEPPLRAVLRSVRYSARLVLFTALRSLLLHAELRSTKCRTPSCGEIKGAPALLEPGSL
jgi:hypothetical protein